VGEALGRRPGCQRDDVNLDVSGIGSEVGQPLLGPSEGG
jgi:hypothetical protein